MTWTACLSVIWDLYRSYSVQCNNLKPAISGLMKKCVDYLDSLSSLVQIDNMDCNQSCNSRRSLCLEPCSGVSSISPVVSNSQSMAEISILSRSSEDKLFGFECSGFAIMWMISQGYCKFNYRAIMSINSRTGFAEFPDFFYEWSQNHTAPPEVRALLISVVINRLIWSQLLKRPFLRVLTLVHQNSPICFLLVTVWLLTFLN